MEGYTMKKIVSVLAALMMLACLIAVPVSAEVKYIGDLQIPYAVTAPTLDGTLGREEWNNAAKFELPAAKMMPVVLEGLSASVPSDLNINIYMSWDETYLYAHTRLPIQTADVFITAPTATALRFSLMLTELQ